MKYIIEIAKEYEEYFKGVLICGIVEGKFAVDVIAREDLEELNADYINENFSDLQDTAYQRGLHDAWEAARKLFSTMADSDIEKAFPIEWNNGGFNALINLQPQEAIAKLKVYEEKQKADDKIEVGDVVRLCRHKVPYIVTSCDGDDDTYILMTVNGGFIKAEKYNVRKIGRHFDINSILEDMRND